MEHENHFFEKETHFPSTSMTLGSSRSFFGGGCISSKINMLIGWMVVQGGPLPAVAVTPINEGITLLSLLITISSGPIL